MIEIHIQIILGLLLGILTGVTGASGMSIFISMLMLLNIPPKIIISYSFILTGVNSLVALPGKSIKLNIEKYIFVLIIIFSICGGLIGNNLLLDKFNSKSLGVILNLFVLIAGIYLVFEIKNNKKTIPKKNNYILTLSVSLLSGVLMGIFGGGGAIFITLALVYCANFSYSKAIYLALIITISSTFPIIFQNYLNKSNIMPIIYIISISVTLSYIISKFVKIKDNLIKKILGLYLIILSFYNFL